MSVTILGAARGKPEGAVQTAGAGGKIRFEWNWPGAGVDDWTHLFGDAFEVRGGKPFLNMIEGEVTYAGPQLLEPPGVGEISRARVGAYAVETWMTGSRFGETPWFGAVRCGVIPGDATSGAINRWTYSDLDMDGVSVFHDMQRVWYPPLGSVWTGNLQVHQPFGKVGVRIEVSPHPTTGSTLIRSLVKTPGLADWLLYDSRDATVVGNPDDCTGHVGIFGDRVLIVSRMCCVAFDSFALEVTDPGDLDIPLMRGGLVTRMTWGAR